MGCMGFRVICNCNTQLLCLLCENSVPLHNILGIPGVMHNKSVVLLVRFCAQLKIRQYKVSLGKVYVLSVISHFCECVRSCDSFLYSLEYLFSYTQNY
jgi:hypothetical protein